MIKILKSIFPLLLIALLIIPISVFATNSKDINVALEKKYEKCRFDIRVERESNYDCYIVSPNGTTHKTILSNESNLTYYSIIDNPVTGMWTVKISDNSNAESDLGKVSVTVSAETEKIQPVSENIVVAKEIDGLKTYLKDDKVIVEWVDETIGNVDISIADIATNKIIAKERVSDNYYETVIPKESKEVSVNIVPSTSSKIEGAGIKYILENNYNPNISIKADESKYTNAESFTIEVNSEDDYIYDIYLNDNTVLKEEKSSGNHIFQISTVEGENNVVIYVIDKNTNNMKSYTYKFERDSIAPVLKLGVDFVEGYTTTNNNVIINGNVSDFDKLYINKEETIPTWEGYFEKEILLNRGNNKILLEAIDVAGNVSSYEYNITMIIRDYTSLCIKVGIVIFALATVIIITRLVNKLKRKNNKLDNENIVKLSKKTNQVKKPTINISIQTTILLIITIIIIVFSRIIFGIGIVESLSMSPTLDVGEKVFINKLAYAFESPKRGDVIIFNSEENQSILVKRVIGIPNDHISFIDGYVFINGQICDEQYIQNDIETNSNLEFDVPSNSVFVLGDNRENSHDSRFFINPYIEEDDIIGKIF